MHTFSYIFIPGINIFNRWISVPASGLGSGSKMRSLELVRERERVRSLDPATGNWRPCYGPLDPHYDSLEALVKVLKSPDKSRWLRLGKGHGWGRWTPSTGHWKPCYELLDLPLRTTGPLVMGRWTPRYRPLEALVKVLTTCDKKTNHNYVW